MKYSLIAAALLALAVTACDPKEPATPPGTPSDTTTEQTSPSDVVDVQMPPPADETPASTEEAPGATTEEPAPEAAAEPAAEVK